MPVEGVREGGLRAVVVADSSACPHPPMLLSRSSTAILAAILACAAPAVPDSVPAPRAPQPASLRPADPRRAHRGRHGEPVVRGDVAIRGDRIAAVGLLPGAQARDTIDATGLSWRRGSSTCSGTPSIRCCATAAAVSQDHAGDHHRDHRRGHQRRAGERATRCASWTTARAQVTWTRPERLLRASSQRPARHQPRHLRHRGLGAPLRDGRRRPRAPRRPSWSRCGPGGRRHAAGRDGAVDRAWSTPRPRSRRPTRSWSWRRWRRATAAATRRTSAARATGWWRRWTRPSTSARRRAPGWRSTTSRQRQGQLGEDAGGGGGHRGGARPRRGRGGRPVPVRRVGHRPGRHPPQLGARRRHRGHAGAPARPRHARAHRGGAHRRRHRLEHRRQRGRAQRGDDLGRAREDSLRRYQGMRLERGGARPRPGVVDGALRPAAGRPRRAPAPSTSPCRSPTSSTPCASRG